MTALGVDFGIMRITNAVHMFWKSRLLYKIDMARYSL